MGFRFRRTVSLFPGVRLNLSRSGVSASVGVRGATVTLGRKGNYANIGIPGSGLSYRTRLSGSLQREQEARAANVEVTGAYEAERPRAKAWPVLFLLCLLPFGFAVFSLSNKGQHGALGDAPSIASSAPAAQAIAPAGNPSKLVDRQRKGRKHASRHKRLKRRAHSAAGPNHRY